MAYDGTLTPGSAQGYGPQNNIQMQYAIAKALLGNQPQHMQSWLQPMAQMANTAAAAKYMNAAKAAQQANAGAGLPGMPGADPNAAASAAPSNPFSGLFGSIFGGGSGP